MTSSTIKVWLPTPEAAELMGGLPEGIAADVWTGGEQLPDSADEVEVVVLPFGVADAQMQGLAKLPRLRLIQLLSAGAERAIPFVPPGVTLANARGAHDPAVAEWIMAVILAEVRHLPKYMAAQQAQRWEHDAARPLSGQTILIVGYGSIGEVTERMLAPMDVNVKRVARTAREGVSSMDDLPAMLPNADIVVLLVPVTPATTKMVDEAFLARMKDGALLVNAARGSIVDTDALLKELTVTSARRARRHGPRAAPGRPSALVRARPAAHPARRRGHHGRHGARARHREGPAGPLRRRRAADQRRRPAGLLTE